MPQNTHHNSNDSAPLWASQNFLTGGAEIRRLVGLAGIKRTDEILEIGPGKGHITRELLKKCGHLIAVELDPRLCARLRERFAGEERLTVRQGDFLRYPLPAGEYKVFANIPFSRTTDIIRKLTQTGRPPRDAWLIVEWGAAKRFSGESLAGWTLRPYFQARIAARIPRDRFHPVPGVDAALLELRRRAEPDLPWGQQGEYRRFLERARSGGLFGMLTKRQISMALRTQGLPVPGRDGNMEYVQWLCLFRCWRSFHG